MEGGREEVNELEIGGGEEGEEEERATRGESSENGVGEAELM